MALLTPEPATQAIETWLAAHDGPLVVSEWSKVEVASALAAKGRAKVLRPAQIRTASDAFENLLASGVRVLPLTRTACERAAALCAPVKANLRAGDALHIALALEAHCVALVGADKAMNAAAVREGLLAPTLMKHQSSII